MEAIVSKWGNSSAVRLPKPYLQKLGIEDNDTVKLSIRGNAITIEKPLNVYSFRELAQIETGLSLEDYVQANPYNDSNYIEFGRAGSEEI
ncbi:MAG: AbrB/MazE/SpoVT family DNA-binding domain-containing protein [Defluviitaleaceae bacterium]|nr:AbrB/MazE/SpoVT family DNA-binding domain-containing protein [Defluviitaleaceae bacterium]